jgi:hypothetical protein
MLTITAIWGIGSSLDSQPNLPRFKTMILFFDGVGILLPDYLHGKT